MRYRQIYKDRLRYVETDRLGVKEGTRDTDSDTNRLRLNEGTEDQKRLVHRNRNRKGQKQEKRPRSKETQ